jgi:hypothetical protein
VPARRPAPRSPHTLHQRSCRPFYKDGADVEMGRRGVNQLLCKPEALTMSRLMIKGAGRHELVTLLFAVPPSMRPVLYTGKLRRRCGYAGMRVGEASKPGPPEEEASGGPDPNAEAYPPGLEDEGPHQHYETGSEGESPYLGMFAPRVQTCTMCLDDIVAPDRCVLWPGCRHASHASCAAAYWCASREPAPGQAVPELSAVRWMRCPHRGQVLDQSHGLAIEACIERWGANAEAHAMYAVVEEAAGARSRETGAERSTVRGHANDYNGGRTFAANDVPPPPEPQGMYPLCHHRVGPPPDFLALPFRCMQWSPVAVHTAASNGDRIISGWTEEWSCATCSATVAPSAMAPQGQQAACDGCGAWPVWVYDTHTACCWRVAVSQVSGRRRFRSLGLDGRWERRATSRRGR